MDFALTSDQQNIRDAILKYRARIYELARSLTVLCAATAGVAAIETIQGDFRDLEGLKARAEKVRRDGFCGMLDRPHLSRAQALLAQVEAA